MSEKTWIFLSFFKHIPDEIKLDIKLFHQFDGNLAYCVTNDDKVYACGQKIRNELGYIECKGNNNFVLIEKLCAKKVIEFFGGFGVFYARSETNEIFYWTLKYRDEIFIESLTGWFINISQNNTEQNLVEKEGNIERKRIIQISCGERHYLALIIDGRVLGWGNNEKGQIVRNSGEKYFHQPIVLRSVNETIKSVHCVKDESIALTVTGKLFFLNIEKYFDLNITEIEFMNDEVIFERHSEICVYDSNSKLDLMEFEVVVQKSIFEYILYQKNLTIKTVFIDEDKYYYNKHFFNEKTEQTVDARFKFELDFAKYWYNQDMFFLSDSTRILKSKIKCFYKSNDLTLYVTKDDKVYIKSARSIHKKNSGKLEIGQGQYKFGDLNEIHELEGKNIEEFYETGSFMFAKSVNDEFYCWGENDQGQLGRGFKSDQYEQPGQCYDLTHKSIIQMSFGSKHCLALTSCGVVYGWGSNVLNQLSFEDYRDNILNPEVLKLGTSPIKYINCKETISFCVDIDGNAYYWGKYHSEIPPCAITKLNIPKVIKVLKILSSVNCVILNETGNVFIYCLENNRLLKTMDLDSKVINMCECFYEILIETEDLVYKFNEPRGKAIKTKYIDSYDYFSNVYFSTQNTIQIKAQNIRGHEIKYLITKVIDFLPDQKNGEFLTLKEKSVYNKKFETHFNIVKLLGSGAYGSVYSVEEKTTGELFAIKRIKVEDEWKYNLSEINVYNMMSEFNSYFVAKYYESWIELDSHSMKYLYIKMELCSGNLRHLINKLNKHFNRDDLKIFRFFLSCEIFKEIVECLGYFHSQNIIHRDLKPENVVITEGSETDFLKLCDFNISKVLGFDERAQSFTKFKAVFKELCQQSSIDYKNFDNPKLKTVTKEDNNGLSVKSTKQRQTGPIGTVEYMAPEIKFGTYDMKCDIYSLALIATEIFNFKVKINKIKHAKDLSIYMKLYAKTKMEDNFRQLLDLLEHCLIRVDYHLRPDCKEILEKINEFSLEKSLVLQDESLHNFLSALEQSRDDYLVRIFLRKIGIGDIQDLVFLSEITQKRISSEFLCKATIHEINYLFIEGWVDDTDDDLVIQAINLVFQVMQVHSHNDIIRMNVISILSKTFTDKPFAQDHLIEAIDKMTEEHTNDHAPCIFATECFYSITKDPEEKIEIESLKKVVNAIISTMENHPDVQELLKYSMLALKPDRIIEDVDFDRLRLIKFVFNIMVNFPNSELNKIAVELLSLLVYDINTTREISNLASNPAYIEILLDIIRTRLTIACEEDPVLEPTFSTLSSFSDYSSETCDMFVQKNGLDLCLQVLKKFHHELDIETSVLCLLGNIAEHSHLRSYLMSPDYLTMLRDFMKTLYLKISYSAARIIANLCCDSTQWISSSIDLNNILDELLNTVLNWNKNQNEVAVHRSFVPLLRLLNCSGYPSIQLFAIWDIRNACLNNPERYSKLLLDEGGVKTIQIIIESPGAESVIKLKKYCQETLDIVQNELAENFEESEIEEMYQDGNSDQESNLSGQIEDMQVGTDVNQ